MPIAATTHTAAGARAFAKFFIQTIDWGYATTSSTYMRRYFQPSCNECRIVRLSLDNARRDKQHYVGGRVTIRKVGQPTRGGPNGELSVTVIVNITAGELIDAKGRASNPDMAHIGFLQQVGLKWRDRQWSVVSAQGRAT